jgi:hypothetical protein
MSAGCEGKFECVQLSTRFANVCFVLHFSVDGVRYDTLCSVSCDSDWGSSVLMHLMDNRSV